MEVTKTLWVSVFIFLLESITGAVHTWCVSYVCVERQCLKIMKPIGKKERCLLYCCTLALVPSYPLPVSFSLQKVPILCQKIIFITSSCNVQRNTVANADTPVPSLVCWSSLSQNANTAKKLMKGFRPVVNLSSVFLLVKYRLNILLHKTKMILVF